MTVPPTQRRILLVEDDADLRENYRIALERAGYRVSEFESAAPALSSVDANAPDLALLDIGLGADREGGFALCQALRMRSTQLPIMFLTARDDDVDLISGLRLGADDYLSKRISLAHLIARVHALFRRVDALSGPIVDAEARTVGALSLGESRLEARWRDRWVDLTVTEFWLVASLARYPGQVRSRAQLMQAASVVLDEQTITAHIKRIRRKFEQIDRDFDAIETVYGMGYRWTSRGTS